MRNKPKGARSAPKSKAKSKAGRTKAKADRRQVKKLRPGQLDGLVLGYMKKHKNELPLTPTRVAHGIERSSGAVGNCLARLDKAGEVKLANKKPREYDLTGGTK